MPSRNDLARIHIAKKELKLEEAKYRRVLWVRYGKESAAELTERQAADLIEYFRRKGWRPSSFAQRGLIHILWRELAAAGTLDRPGEKSLASFVEHVTGKNDPRKLTVVEASRVIEILKRWIERVEEDDGRH